MGSLLQGRGGSHLFCSAGGQERPCAGVPENGRGKGAAVALRPPRRRRVHKGRFVAPTARHPQRHANAPCAARWGAMRRNGDTSCMEPRVVSSEPKSAATPLRESLQIPYANFAGKLARRRSIRRGATTPVARAFLPSSTKISIQIRCRADFCVIFYVLPGEHDKHPPSMDTKHPSIEEHLLLFALPELPLEMSLRLERLFIRALHMGMRDEVR